MAIRYYLSVFPLEALIASQLEPEEFGSYMAIGSRKGHHENFIFMEVKGEFGSYFDWEYARHKCVPHGDGEPKHSVYLSIYRVLEHIPLEMLGSIFLVTRDGKPLELVPAAYESPAGSPGYYVYQELCPITPLVVSILNPFDFAQYLCQYRHKIHIPKVIFTDLKIIDFNDIEHTGNLGVLYENKIEHLKDCIDVVTHRKDKLNKTLDRSHIESFSYQGINRGVYLADGENLVMYPMKTLEELKEKHYYWAKSALII